MSAGGGWLYLGTSDQSYIRVRGVVEHPRTLDDCHGRKGQSIPLPRAKVDRRAVRQHDPSGLPTDSKTGKDVDFEVPPPTVRRPPRGMNGSARSLSRACRRWRPRLDRPGSRPCGFSGDGLCG
jgi:hypothetical protein